MSNFADPTEPLDSPAPESPDTASRSPRKSVFRAVRWPWRAVLIGLSPLVLIRSSIALFGPALLVIAPRILWIPDLLLAEAWMFAIPTAIIRRQATVPRLPRPRSVFIEGLCALLALVGLLVTINLIFLLLAQLFGPRIVERSPLTPGVQLLNRVEYTAFVLAAVFVAPVAEELFFRGMLYNALRQRLHAAVAAPLQAIIFGLLHPFALVDAARVALVGLACALLYEWRKTLLAPMLLHSLVNVLGIVMMFWAVAAAPRLGVVGETDERGCKVTVVAPASAAATAGLQVGDVITAVDGEPVRDLPSLVQIIRSKVVGDQVVVKFIRDGTAQQVDAVLKKRQE